MEPRYPDVRINLPKFVVPMGTPVEIVYGGKLPDHPSMNPEGKLPDHPSMNPEIKQQIEEQFEGKKIEQYKISGTVNDTGFINFTDNTFVFGIDITSPRGLEGAKLLVYSIRDEIKNLPMAPGFQLSKEGTKIIQAEKLHEADPSSARPRTPPRPTTPPRPRTPPRPTTPPPLRSPSISGGSRKKKNTKRKRRSIHKRSLKKRLSKKRLSKKRLSRKRRKQNRSKQNKRRQNKSKRR
tara:strand:+ start:3274 stop:3984 length:711 start_codon:yes stop_codon:yes gene_type:complete